MSDPFATAAELAQFTGMAQPDDLARMQSHLELASAVIRRFCDQVLSQVTNDQVTLEAIERGTLILPERPVTAVASVLANGSAVTTYTFTRAGLLHSGTLSVPGPDWTYGATVTYTHGYAETTEEYKAIKAVCLEAASRAFTLNERGASEVLGTTLLESAGYAPEVFLTPGEKMLLGDFGKVLVG